MKTTIELSDELLVEAKAMAARRRTTLKSLIEHALRREIYQSQAKSDDFAAFYERNAMGFLVLKKNSPVPLQEVEELRQEIEDEELEFALGRKSR